MLDEDNIAVPADPILADAARASVLLAHAAYVGNSPHYGVGPVYWAPEHESFPPTTIRMSHTMASSKN